MYTHVFSICGRSFSYSHSHSHSHTICLTFLLTNADLYGDYNLVFYFSFIFSIFYFTFLFFLLLFILDLRCGSNYFSINHVKPLNKANKTNTKTKAKEKKSIKMWSKLIKS